MLPLGACHVAEALAGVVAHRRELGRGLHFLGDPIGRRTIVGDVFNRDGRREMPEHGHAPHGAGAAVHLRDHMPVPTPQHLSARLEVESVGLEPSALAEHGPFVSQAVFEVRDPARAMGDAPLVHRYRQSPRLLGRDDAVLQGGPEALLSLVL